MKYIWTVKFPSRGKTHAAGIHEKPWSYQQITERIGLRENDGTWKHETGNWELQVFGLRETPFFSWPNRSFPMKIFPPIHRPQMAWSGVRLVGHQLDYQIPGPGDWACTLRILHMCVFVYIYIFEFIDIYIYNSLYILYVCVYIYIHM